MNAWIEHARKTVAEALAAGDSPAHWIIRPDIFDAIRMDPRTAGTLSTEITAAPTLLGIPYDFGRPHNRWGIELITCRPATIAAN